MIPALHDESLLTMTSLTFFVTTSRCYAGLLLEDGTILKEEYILNGKTQGAALIPFLNTLWQKAGSPSVDNLIAPRGPGSFTGLRVTLATAIGLQLGFKAAKTYAPTFFDVLLHKAPSQSYAVIDSKRGDYFVCLKDENALTDTNIQAPDSNRQDPLILNMGDFLTFEQEHPDYTRIVEPDLFLKFPMNTFDPLCLIDTLLYLPNITQPHDFTPYYLFEPTFKKMQPIG